MRDVQFPPSVQPQVLAAGQVAQLLGVSEPTFRKRRLTLEERHGFPPKLPGFNTWSRAAVMRWISTNGRPDAPAEPEASAEAAELERAYARGEAA